MNRVHKEAQQSGELVLSMLLLIQKSSILKCLWCAHTVYLKHYLLVSWSLVISRSVHLNRTLKCFGPVYQSLRTMIMVGNKAPKSFLQIIVKRKEMLWSVWPRSVLLLCILYKVLATFAMFEVHSQPFVCLWAISPTYCQPLWKPARFLPPSQVVSWHLAVDWYKEWGNNNVWGCSNKRFILAKNARIFREIRNKLTATDWKKEFHSVGLFTDFDFVSVLEEWAGSGLAGSSLTQVDCSPIEETTLT